MCINMGIDRVLEWFEIKSVVVKLINFKGFFNFWIEFCGNFIFVKWDFVLNVKLYEVIIFDMDVFGIIF